MFFTWYQEFSLVFTVIVRVKRRILCKLYISVWFGYWLQLGGVIVSLIEMLRLMLWPEWISNTLNFVRPKHSCLIVGYLRSSSTQFQSVIIAAFHLASPLGDYTPLFPYRLPLKLMRQGSSSFAIAIANVGPIDIGNLAPDITKNISLTCRRLACPLPIRRVLTANCTQTFTSCELRILYNYSKHKHITISYQVTLFSRESYHDWYGSNTMYFEASHA